MKRKNKLIAIVGPTAVGKTSLAIALAQKLETQIVSGDSMLVYRGMDIGTAKPAAAERKGVAHHLIDIVEPGEEFSATRFKELAEEKIAAINNTGKIPILAGGTGLYVKSLIEGYKFNATPGDEAFRKEIEAIAAARGKKYVHAMLEKIDPETARRLHVNDFRRVVRALEVSRMGGETISQDRHGGGQLAYDAIVLGLTMDRARLYERINRRVDEMIEAGLIDEVKELLMRGAPIDCQAMQGIGYKEIAAYLRGESNLNAAVDLVKQSTRRFAKRQLTWFKKMPYIKWYDTEKITQAEIMEEVYNLLAGEFQPE